MRNYTAVARRTEEWAKTQHPIPDLWAPQTWSAWIESTQTRPQGRLSYNKIATAICSLRQKLQGNPLALHRRSLLGEGAATPIKQAPPLPRELLDHPTLRPHRLALLVAWKTASRWDEVQRITRESCTILPPTADNPLQVLVDWSDKTKASRCNPHRASRFTLIEGPLTEELRSLLLPLHPRATLTVMTTTALDTILRPLGFSAHSIKAGALNVAAKALSSRPGLESEMLLSRLAKHQHPLDPTTTTLGYLRDHVALARTLGTHQVTRYL